MGAGLLVPSLSAGLQHAALVAADVPAYGQVHVLGELRHAVEQLPRAASRESRVETVLHLGVIPCHVP